MHFFKVIPHYHRIDKLNTLLWSGQRVMMSLETVKLSKIQNIYPKCQKDKASPPALGTTVHTVIRF